MNGDVRLRVEGLMLERLVERAISEGARFRTVVRTGAHTMEMATDSAGERILCELCAKFSMPIQVLERSGGTGARMKMRSRMSALAGAIACIACTLICLSRVWMIDIRAVGDAAIDAGALRARLEDLGVREGMARADVNADALALQMSALSPEYSFIGVRLQGVRLLLEAAGEEAAPETFDISDPRDLIASRSGVVVSVNVRAGEACVQAGDTVALSLRTERVGFARTPLGGCALPATLKSRHYAGGSMRAVLTLDDGREVLAQCPSADRAQGEIGERVLLSWNPGEAPVVR